MFDELYDLRYGFGEFNVTRVTLAESLKADELFREIQNAFDNRRYEEMIEKAEEAREFIARVKAAYIERQAYQRARFSEEVWEAVGGNEYVAERAVELAEAAADLVGAKKALHIFKRELRAPYGRISCQNGVRDSIPIAQTDIGDSFLSLCRVSDVKTWLAGAVAWLKIGRGGPESQANGGHCPLSAESSVALAKFGKK